MGGRKNSLANCHRCPAVNRSTPVIIHAPVAKHCSEIRKHYLYRIMCCIKHEMRLTPHRREWRAKWDHQCVESTRHTKKKMKWTVCVLFDARCVRTKWKVTECTNRLLPLNRTLHCTKWDCGTAIRKRTQYGLSSRVGLKHTELALLRRLTLFRGFAFVHCGTNCSPLDWMVMMV